MSETNASIFKTIDAERRGTTFQEVVSQLREMIHRGELRPGDRLPPERDLAKRLGVSRPTLRAGISSLAAVGVLQPRRGAGTFVVETEGPPSLDSHALRLMASLQRFTPAEMFPVMDQMASRLRAEVPIRAKTLGQSPEEALKRLDDNIASLKENLTKRREFLLDQSELKVARKN